MPLCIRMRDNNSMMIKAIHVASGDVFYIDSGKYHRHGAQIVIEGDKEVFHFDRVDGVTKKRFMPIKSEGDEEETFERRGDVNGNR